MECERFWRGDVRQLTKGPFVGSDSETPALVAQRIRASDYGSEGREFESLQARCSTAFGQFFLSNAAAVDRCLPSKQRIEATHGGFRNRSDQCTPSRL